MPSIHSLPPCCGSTCAGRVADTAHVASSVLRGDGLATRARLSRHYFAESFMLLELQWLGWGIMMQRGLSWLATFAKDSFRLVPDIALLSHDTSSAV